MLSETSPITYTIRIQSEPRVNLGLQIKSHIPSPTSEMPKTPPSAAASAACQWATSQRPGRHRRSTCRPPSEGLGSHTSDVPKGAGASYSTQGALGNSFKNAALGEAQELLYTSSLVPVTLCYMQLSLPADLAFWLKQVQQWHVQTSGSRHVIAHLKYKAEPVGGRWRKVPSVCQFGMPVDRSKRQASVPVLSNDSPGREP